MSVTSGFYNSLNGDRKYNAEQMSSIFDGIIKDGVYSNYLNQFKVKETYEEVDDPENEGKKKQNPKPTKTIIVDKGRAWFNRTWTLNDAELDIDLTNLIPAAPESYRYIAIVIDIDSDERDNKIIAVPGEIADIEHVAKPEMIHTETHNQYALAYIRANGDTDKVPQDIIENAVGTSETPLATGVFAGMTADQFIAQWQAQFNTTINADDKYFNDWFAERAKDFDNYSEKQVDDFNKLKDSITSQLSANQYTYLVGLIDDIKPLEHEDIDRALENS